MDPQVVDLARTAGTTVVTLMATDTWNRARDGLVALWRRVHPERADQIADQLDATREELVAAREASDELSERELTTEWQSRLRRLLVAEPALAEELHRFLEEFAPADASQPAAGGTSMHATASGHGRVYQAGRDQHITEG
ncbi:hypothetical protein [Kitasatospora acidiphila]|uniref:hypothetical protein n=1 Tax=Kitasatospora acidiphila TaxID=2567942 RepID=UPI003C758D7E